MSAEEAIQNLQAQLTVLMQELNVQQQKVQRLETENTQLQQAVLAQPVQQKAQAEALQSLVREVQKMSTTSRSSREMLMDVKGIGRPTTFSNEEHKYTAWARKTENYIVGVFGEEFRQVLEWTLGCETTITTDMVDETYGEDADVLDRVADLWHKCNQVYQVLMALTEDEGHDLVIS